MTADWFSTCSHRFSDVFTKGFSNVSHAFLCLSDFFVYLIHVLPCEYTKVNIFSEMLNDRTQGQDQIPEWTVTLLSLPSRGLSEWGDAMASSSSKLVYTPIWIPQLTMSIGTVLLAIALWDSLYRMLVTGINPNKLETVE